MTHQAPPPRVLVTKIGLDGHDRGSRLVAAFLRDAGMEVIYTPPWQRIEHVVRLAEEEDVDVVGVSSLSTDHRLLPKLMDALRARGLGHVRRTWRGWYGAWLWTGRTSRRRAEGWWKAGGRGARGRLPPEPGRLGPDGPRSALAGPPPPHADTFA
ncbi:MAG: cobalamin-dependent protein [Pseudomonadota bacterium]